jgi:hypothetical protein
MASFATFLRRPRDPRGPSASVRIQCCTDSARRLGYRARLWRKLQHPNPRVSGLQFCDGQAALHCQSALAPRSAEAHRRAPRAAPERACAGRQTGRRQTCTHASLSGQTCRRCGRASPRAFDFLRIGLVADGAPATCSGVRRATACRGCLYATARAARAKTKPPALYASRSPCDNDDDDEHCHTKRLQAVGNSRRRQAEQAASSSGGALDVPPCATTTI